MKKPIATSTLDKWHELIVFVAQSAKLAVAEILRVALQSDRDGQRARGPQWDAMLWNEAIYAGTLVHQKGRRIPVSASLAAIPLMSGDHWT